MLTKAQLQFVQRLQQKKFRLSEGLYLAEGTKIAEELLNSGILLYAIFALADWIDRNRHLPHFPASLVQEISADELKKISSLSSPNEVICVVPLRYPKFEAGAMPGKLSLLLDTVQDPGNFGTIVRIADWFGIEQVYCSETCVDLYNPKVIQSSMGSFLRCSVIYADPLEVIAAAHRQNIMTYAAALEGANMYEMQFTKEALLVMGNESKGISPEVLEQVKQCVRIPAFGKGGVDSLNVSIATAILCAEFRR